MEGNLYSKIYARDLQRDGEIVGYKKPEGMIQVHLDGDPVDEVRWFRVDEVDFVLSDEEDEGEEHEPCECPYCDCRNFVRDGE